MRDDPRLELSAESRRQWTDTVLQLADLYRSTSTLATAAKALADKPGAPPATTRRRPNGARLPAWRSELQARVLRLYQAMNGSLSFPTADQRAQVEYLSSLANVIDARLRLAQSK